MKSSKSSEKFTFNEKSLRDDLVKTAKIYGISKATAEPMARIIATKVSARLQKRSVITTDDLNRFIAAEAEKFNKDLAYDYKNRGKII